MHLIETKILIACLNCFLFMPTESAIVVIVIIQSFLNITQKFTFLN